MPITFDRRDVTGLPTAPGGRVRPLLGRGYRRRRECVISAG